MAGMFRVSLVQIVFKRIARFSKECLHSNYCCGKAFHSLKFAFHARCQPGFIKITSSSQRGQGRYLWCAGMLSIMGLFDKKQVKTIEEQITDLIKMAILEHQKDHHKEAEQLLFLALGTAQEHKNSAAIIYINDLMANQALKQEKFVKADMLFQRTLRMMLEDGVSDDDNAILEISLKLAYIYTKLGRENDAETGYLYVQNHLEKKVDLAQTEDEDTILLWGMCADSYGRFLMGNGKYKEACELFKKAYESCKLILGISNPQTLVLLNNIGSASGMSGNFDEGVFYLKQAINIAHDNNVEDLPAFYCNLGMLYLQMGMIPQAEIYCKKAAASNTESVYYTEAINCLKQVNSCRNGI